MINKLTNDRIENLKARIITLQDEREIALEDKEYGTYQARGIEIDVLTKLIEEEKERLYNEHKANTPWITSDYKTYVNRLEFIDAVAKNYPYDYDYYEQADGPHEDDALGLEADEWAEVEESWSKWANLRG